MSVFKRLFCEHPASVDESYVEHMAFAGGFGFRMILAGLACMIHGLFPFLFIRTGSRCVRDLHDQLVSSGRPSNAVGVKGERVA